MRNVFASIRRFFAELRRRNVYKVAAVYGAVAFVVVQAARLLVPAMVLPEWLYRAVVAVALLGFPFVLVFAWAFELTPEGMRQTSTEDLSSEATQPEAPARARSGLGLWLGAALLAVGLAGGWWVLAENTGENPSSSPPSIITDRSIAVLPFAPLSSGEQSQTFARGIHDDLLTRLANISELKVISRTAVQQYRGTDLTTGQIADSLGVRWVMEGGVQVLGDQIQVNAQLIDPRSETHAWADDYQRDLTAEDLFAIQGEITG